MTDTDEVTMDRYRFLNEIWIHNTTHSIASQIMNNTYSSPITLEDFRCALRCAAAIVSEHHRRRHYTV